MYLIVTKARAPGCAECQKNKEYIKVFIDQNIKSPRAKKEVGVQTTFERTPTIKLSSSFEPALGSYRSLEHQVWDSWLQKHYDRLTEVAKAFCDQQQVTYTSLSNMIAEHKEDIDLMEVENVPAEKSSIEEELRSH